MNLVVKNVIERRLRMNENYLLDMDEKELSLKLMILLFIQIFFALI